MAITDDSCIDIEVARLDGFLRGISFLNTDFRHNFSEAFFVPNKGGELSPQYALKEYFSEQFTMVDLRSHCLENWVAEVEQSLPDLLHGSATDRSNYIAHKAMGHLIDAVGDSKDIEVVQLDALVAESDVKLRFFCFRFAIRYLVVYFVNGKQP